MHSRTIAASYPNASLIPQGSYSDLPSITLGRPMTLIGSGDGVHLRLRSRTISPVHAMVLNVDGKLLLRDLASQTHVYVNRRKVRECTLQHGDQIRMGRIRFEVQITDPTPCEAAEPAPAAWLWSESGEATLVCSSLYLIGSHPESDLLLDAHEPAAQAIIVTLGRQRLLRNLGPVDSVHVNGAGVQQAVLIEGDVIEIGAHRFQFELEEQYGADESNTKSAIEPVSIPPEPSSAISTIDDRIDPPTSMISPMPVHLGMQVSIDQQAPRFIERELDPEPQPQREPEPGCVAATLGPADDSVAVAIPQPSPVDSQTISPELSERARSWGPLARVLVAVPQQQQQPQSTPAPVAVTAAPSAAPRRWMRISLLAVVIAAMGVGAWLHLRGSSM